jgi:SAM-dependent methyltransferase
MDEDEKNIINKRYNKRLLRYGDDIRTLASGTENHRDLRYQILSEVGLRSGCSVLDVGCGFGDFYKYLYEHGIAATYVGYDINKKFIEIARKKYPKAEFELKDIQIDEFPKFDYIVSSSAFNLRMTKKDNYVFAEDIFRKCFAHARHGVAIDFMTKYVDFEVPDAFYYSPEQLFNIAKKFTKRVCLRHDYPLYEFCIYLFPDFQGWLNNEKAKGVRNI